MLLCVLMLNGQTITIEDNSCFSGGSIFTYVGSDGGSPARNIYTGTTSASEPAKIVWDNGQNQWEIQLLDDFEGTAVIDFYANTFASSPNPPTLGTGSWNVVMICSGLTQFDGTGTQSDILSVELVSFNGS